jgi:glycosyltransferase involved in cell wall biosynthesis
MKFELFLIRAQKALHILKKQGVNALIARIKTKANIQTSRTSRQLNAKSTQAITDTKAIFIGRIFSKEKLESRLTSALQGSVIRIAFSHDNYLENVGGLQLKIADEQLEVNRSGKDYLHIFPYGAGLTLTEFNDDSVIGINLNGGWVGYTHPQILIDYLAEISSEFNVERLSIHHVMGFDLGFIEQVIEIAQHPRVVFWLHDFFSLCPGYLLLRNDLEFCGVPDVKSNACSLCIYGERRTKHLTEFESFFTRNAVEVISPSEFALELWRKGFPVKGIASTVCPHATLDYQKPIPNASKKSAIKVAFVGFPVHHKGWETWLKLTDKFGSDRRYEFILFSKTRRPSRKFKNVSISVTKESRNKMAETLRDHNIDVAFLWSICPETFSFTLYESLAAGCAILTNRNSGNIQAYVREHPEAGIVLEHENALMELFEGSSLGDYLAAGQKEGRKSAKLIINEGC